MESPMIQFSAGVPLEGRGVMGDNVTLKVFQATYNYYSGAHIFGYCEEWQQQMLLNTKLFLYNYLDHIQEQTMEPGHETQAFFTR